MRKFFLGIGICFWLSVPLFAAQSCRDFDDDGNIITLDCVTGERIITQEDIARENERIQAEKEKQQAQQLREQQKQEKQVAKIKREKEKRRAKAKKFAAKNTKQSQVKMKYRSIEIDGETYYLSAAPKSFSERIEAGEWMISAGGGAGEFFSGRVTSDNEGINLAATERGRVSLWNASLSGMYFFNSYIGAGLELGMGAANGKRGYYHYSGRKEVAGEINISLYNVLAVGRFNLNPAHSVRAYFPFGAGYGQMKHTFSEHVYQYYPYYTSRYYERSKNIPLFIAFAGLGLEFALTQHVSFGLEGRYNQFFASGETFCFMNGLAKINVKF